MLVNAETVLSVLKDKALRSLERFRGFREPRVEDIFKRIAYVFPSDVTVINYARKPMAIFNPGAVLVNNELWVFPRLIFDYYTYVSSIGLFKLRVEDLLSKGVEKPVEIRIVVWPRELWEFRGCEDPRVHIHDNYVYMLYTGYGYHRLGNEYRLIPVQSFAVLSPELKPLRRDFFKLSYRGQDHIVQMKDSTFIDIRGSSTSMLCRPTIDSIEINWRCLADLENLKIDVESMDPVMVFEPWELKIGWSTNVVELSKGEYLVGWHAVLQEDLSYRNGIAVVDAYGNVLAVSNYLLVPRGIVEEYGDRPLVIFGNGLVRYRELVIWIGGVSDYAVGIFATPLDKLLEKLKWIQRA